MQALDLIDIGSSIIVIYTYLKKIEVFDIEKETVITRSIELPFGIDGTFSEEKIFIVNQFSNSNHIICGFARQYFDDIAVDLITVLMRFYVQEWLHIIQYTGEHWKISLSDILNL